MHHHDRRTFLLRMTGGVAALSGAACTGMTVGSGATPNEGARPRRGFSTEPWVQRIEQARHRAVFDSPAIGDGTALDNAYVYMDGYRQSYDARDDEMAVVVVVRHAAMAMVLSTALWHRYSMGTNFNLNDPSTEKPAERNPYESMTDDEIRANEGIAAGITNLQRRGVAILACSLALSATAGRIAKRLNLDPATVNAEIRAGLIPGVVIVPSGIFGVTRAQEAGCVLVKST
jgi:intracellular sulfur oxidation DsrE/DsrF family protein